MELLKVGKEKRALKVLKAKLGTNAPLPSRPTAHNHAQAPHVSTQHDRRPTPSHTHRPQHCFRAWWHACRCECMGARCPEHHERMHDGHALSAVRPFAGTHKRGKSKREEMAEALRKQRMGN